MIKTAENFLIYFSVLLPFTELRLIPLAHNERVLSVGIIFADHIAAVLPYEHTTNKDIGFHFQDLTIDRRELQSVLRAGDSERLYVFLGMALMDQAVIPLITSDYDSGQDLTSVDLVNKVSAEQKTILEQHAHHISSLIIWQNFMSKRTAH